MQIKETLDKAYGNVSKEISFGTDLWEFIPSRSFRYFCIKLFRKIFR